jgi:hypothetical protein
MSGAVHERELDLVVREVCEVGRHGGGKGREPEVEGDTALGALCTPIKRRGGEVS